MAKEREKKRRGREQFDLIYGYATINGKLQRLSSVDEGLPGHKSTSASRIFDEQTTNSLAALSLLAETQCESIRSVIQKPHLRHIHHP